MLTGGATAICGASAALALAAALPNHPQKERATLFTVIGVSALSTLAMIVYPMIAHGLSLMLACINSTGWIAPAVQGGVNEFSRWCLVISISAPGMQGFTGWLLVTVRLTTGVTSTGFRGDCTSSRRFFCVR